MKNINLLIRKSITELYGGRLVVIVTVLVTTSVTLLWWYGQTLTSQVREQQELVVRLESRVSDLQSEKQIDNRSVQYEQLKQRIIGLRNQRVDWKPLLEGVIDRLPEAGRINQVKIGITSAEGHIPVELAVDLKDWQTLKQYMTMLQKHPSIANVQLKGLNRETLVDPAVAKLEQVKQSVMSQTQIPVAPPLTNESRDPFLESLNQYLAPSADSLLGEDEEPTEEDPMSGPFTTDDFQRAEQVLEQLNANNRLIIPDATPIPAQRDEESSVQQDMDSSKVEFLRCQLEIMFRLNAQEAG